MAVLWRNFMTQNIPSWPKMSLHDPKWPLNILQGPNTWLYAILGYPGPFSEANVAPVGHWKGSRVVQYDTISCSIPMGSVLGPFGFMQGHFWCYFGPLWGPCWPPKRAQGGPTWHIIMLYSHLKWFRVIWGHAVPFWAILVILSHSGHFGALLGHFGAPVGTWMAPGWSNMTYIHVIYQWAVF